MTLCGARSRASPVADLPPVNALYALFGLPDPDPEAVAKRDERERLAAVRTAGVVALQARGARVKGAGSLLIPGAPPDDE